MASSFEPRSSQTAKEATGSELTERYTKLLAQTQATSSRWRSRRRERNRNPGCRQICGRLSRPPRKRGRCGRTSRPSRAEIGSTGSPPPSGQRLARVGSTMPARCSPPGSDAFAASIGRGSIVKALALLKRRFRSIQVGSMTFAIKAEVSDPWAETFAFSAQKTMYGGKHIAKGDTIFVFASENEGGPGLIAGGVVTSAKPIAKKRGIARQTPRVSITIRRTALAKRRLGRSELRVVSDWNDGRPETELNFKFYRQATNKIVGISDKAAAFLRGFF